MLSIYYFLITVQGCCANANSYGMMNQFHFFEFKFGIFEVMTVTLKKITEDQKLNILNNFTHNWSYFRIRFLLI
jgi:hypothetical protein